MTDAIDDTKEKPTKPFTEDSDLYYKDKKRQKKYCRFCNLLWKEHKLVAISTSVLGVVLLICLALSGKSSTTDIRVSPTSTSTIRAVKSMNIRDPSQNDEQLLLQRRKEEAAQIKASLRDAKKDIADAEVQGIVENEGMLRGTMKQVEQKMKEGLDRLLMKDWGVSSIKAKNVEAEVAKRLEDEVEDLLVDEAVANLETTNEDIDEVVREELNAKTSSKSILKDIKEMRNYAADGALSDVDNLSNIIKDKMRDAAESIQKEVIKEKLGIDTSEEELEDSEIQAHISHVKEKIEKTEDEETDKMIDSVEVALGNIEERVKNVLDEILRENKGMTESQVKNVESQVMDRLDDEVAQKIADKVAAVDEEVIEAEEELEDIVREDEAVIERAKDMGMQTDSDSKKEIDIIEEDLDAANKNFGEHLKVAVNSIGFGIKSSMQKMVENIEKDVLEDNGIDVTKSELHKLALKSKNK